jgi:hypothetical protein
MEQNGAWHTDQMTNAKGWSLYDPHEVEMSKKGGSKMILQIWSGFNKVTSWPEICVVTLFKIIFLNINMKGGI